MLLVVTHSQTGGTQALTDALLAGARDGQIHGVQVVWRDALEATPEDVLASAAIVLGTPENFGYMSGALKHFFDTIYYPCLRETVGRPYAAIVHGASDTTGAVRSIEKIVTGLQWSAVGPALEVTGAPSSAARDAAYDLAATLGATVLD